MNRWLCSTLACVSLCAGAWGSEAAIQPSTRPAATSPSEVSGVETIVILRHGEKPASGNGNLTPQGLNRALALSSVLPKKFGRPDYIFAPDPQGKVKDRGGVFNYVRPLVTIDPTAIRLGMPVQTPCSFYEIDKLDDELTRPQYAKATLFVAWEHFYARAAAVDLVKRFGGDAAQVPQWPGTDYDSLFVITITRAPGHAPTVGFVHDHEGLDGLSQNMPVPARKE